MSRLVGVDVGASHVEAAVALEDGDPIHRIRRRGTFVKPGRIAAVAEAISTTISDLIQAARSDTTADCIVVGAAGAHTEALIRELQHDLNSSFSGALIQVTTDGAIALTAAFADDPGIVVCAGSGSIAYARTAGSEIKRVGGLGPELDDAGSGYAIGRAGLRAAARAADGRLPKTTLERSIAAALAVSSLDDLVEWAWGAERNAVAALSEVVCSEAVAGDEVARKIVHAAAVDLGALVHSLAQFFGRYSGVEVAFSGGVLSEDSPVRWELLRYLGDRIPNATVIDKPVDPVSGALAMARSLMTN